MDKEIYLDNAATTKMLEEVNHKMFEIYDKYWANPSSQYRLGKKSRSEIEKARETIAGLLGVDSCEIIFTSGGAESNNLALKGLSSANKKFGNHIITSKIEHSTVLRACECLENEGFKVSYIDVTEDGIVDIEKLEKEITDETILISVMAANNETGVIQPIDEISSIVENKNKNRNNKIIFHTDAIQYVGKEIMMPKDKKISAMSVSSHKFYGPKGVGFLYLDSSVELDKEICGGAQERNKRSGTENVQGIIAMAMALELVYKDIIEEKIREEELKNYFEKRIINEIPDVTINGANANRLSCISNLTIKNCDVQTMIISLDMDSIYVSGGSACMSGAMEKSHVLKAMNLSNEALNSSLRISIGRYNDKEDIDIFLEKFKKIVENEREFICQTQVI